MPAEFGHVVGVDQVAGDDEAAQPTVGVGHEFFDFEEAAVGVSAEGQAQVAGVVGVEVGGSQLIFEGHGGLS